MINDLAQFPGIKINIPLRNFSSFRIGGNADYFYECKDLSQLPILFEVIQSASKLSQKELPLIVIGGGSNTIFSDDGFRGLVIKITANNLKIENEKVTADAGIILNALILKTIEAGLVGLEKLFGIPGTLGGAIRGNAGAHGTEIWDLIESIRYCQFDGHSFESPKIKTSPRLDFSHAYRSSSIKIQQRSGQKIIILGATLQLKKNSNDTKAVLANVIETQKMRNAKYPSQPNCGSFFKNIPATPGLIKTIQTTSSKEVPADTKYIPAGLLTELAGCKGLRIGDAQVSEKHGNFLVNLGAATQKNVIELCAQVKKRVHSKFGTTLENEVQFIGTDGYI